MQKNDAVPHPQTDTPKAPALLAVLAAALLAAACGGPAADLHDVIDGVREQTEVFLDVAGGFDPERLEAAAQTALPRCASDYERPAFAESPGPYIDVVEIPEIMEDASYNAMRTACSSSEALLRSFPAQWPRILEQAEGFIEYTDLLHAAIDDLEPDQAETIATALDVAALSTEEIGGHVRGLPPPDPDDTLRRRYRELRRLLLTSSDELREAGRSRHPGTGFDPGVLPDFSVRANREAFADPSTYIIEQHARAVEYVDARNNYNRRVFEAPDAADPDEAAGDWSPLAGTWSGEFSEFYVGGFQKGPIQPVSFTFESDGRVTVDFPERDCRTTLELLQERDAFNRTKTYSQSACGQPTRIVLERTAEDRMRLGSSIAQLHRGNLSPES